MTAKNNITEASLKISLVLAKKQKPFSDGEIIQKCFLECADSLFAEFKNKNEMKKQISDLQLYHQTAAKRVEILSKDTLEMLISDLKTASEFSLALYEFCDITDINQLLI